MVVFVRDEKGHALVMVLILSTVLMIVGSGAVATALGYSRNVALEECQKRAYYIAEAGVQKALAELRQKLVYPATGFENFSLSNEPYGGGMIEKVEVSKETAGSTVYYTIASTGRYPENPAPGQLCGKKMVTAKVEAVPDPFLAYGGPGLKSDTAVHLTGGITSTGGSLLARTGDVKSQAGINGNVGGIYAGGNVNLQGGITSGGGEIKAGDDVHLSGLVSGWSGEIWAGDEVDGPLLQLGNVIIHEGCGANIPGFPLPSFPVVDKGSAWYDRVKDEARDYGQFFNSAEEFLSHPDKGIKWIYNVSIWPIGGLVTVTVWGAELNLNGLYVVNGPMDFNEAYKKAYQLWQQRIREQYPGKEVSFIDVSLDRLAVKADQPVTIVADSITINEGVMGIGGVDTSGIKNPFGLFAVAGDVVYKAVFGSGGRLSVITTGKFDCNTSGNLNLDWVAAKGDVQIKATINLNEAEARIPPGTPVGYCVVSWEIK